MHVLFQKGDTVLTMGAERSHKEKAQIHTITRLNIG
jgi:hypothetical protein